MANDLQEIPKENKEIQNVDELRDHLIKNEFDYFEEGYKLDKIEFEEDNTFTLYGKKGSWYLSDATTLYTTYENDEYMYKFNNDGSVALIENDTL